MNIDAQTVFWKIKIITPLFQEEMSKNERKILTMFRRDFSLEKYSARKIYIEVDNIKKENREMMMS